MWRCTHNCLWRCSRVQLFVALQQGKLFVALYVALYPQLFVALQQGTAVCGSAAGQVVCGAVCGLVPTTVCGAAAGYSSSEVAG